MLDICFIKAPVENLGMINAVLVNGVMANVSDTTVQAISRLMLGGKRLRYGYTYQVAAGPGPLRLTHSEREEKKGDTPLNIHTFTFGAVNEADVTINTTKEVCPLVDVLAREASLAPGSEMQLLPAPRKTRTR